MIRFLAILAVIGAGCVSEEQRQIDRMVIEHTWHEVSECRARYGPECDVIRSALAP